MKLTAEIICFLILFLPTAWEYRDDMHGDFNKKKDVLFRVIIGAAACLANWFFTDRFILKSVLMCFSIFFLIFDYWIATRFAPKGKWFEYGGKKGWFDNIPKWKNLNPWAKFAFRLIVFAVALIYYF